MITILVSDAGSSLTRNFVSCLKLKSGKYVTVGVSSNKFELALSNCDKNYLLPDVSHPFYFDILNNIGIQNKVDFFHTQSDKIVKLVTQNRDKIKFKTFLPNPKTVEICQDKWRSYLAWKEFGVSVPETIEILTKKDLEHAFSLFKPYVWLRMKEGRGGVGSLPASDLDFAAKWIDYFNGWGKYTAAELLTPQSVTWTSIWRDGELLVAQARKRLNWLYGDRTLSGVTGVTGVGEIISEPDIDRLSLASIKAIDEKPNGIFCVDITYDFQGNLNPTEINIGRFFTTINFFAECGLNMPDIYITAALEETLDFTPPLLNPISQGQLWIRGMDVEPRLCDKALILSFEDQLDEMINNIK